MIHSLRDDVIHDSSLFLAVIHDSASTPEK